MCVLPCTIVAIVTCGKKFHSKLAFWHLREPVQKNDRIVKFSASCITSKLLLLLAAPELKFADVHLRFACWSCSRCV